MINSDIPVGLCQCGCGGKTGIATRDREGYRTGEPLRFIRGHVGKLNSIKLHESKFTERPDGGILKLCTKCKTSKPLEEFGKSKYSAGGYRVHCKICERSAARQFYKTNPQPYKKRAHARRDKMKEFYQSFLNELKASMGCLFCRDNTLCILDFHHFIKGVSVYGAASKGRKAVQRELDKCVIACANCHRKTHAGMLCVTKEMLLRIDVPRFQQ